MAASNGQILDALASFRKESGEQREAIISGINEMNVKLNYTNGKVGELYRDVRGDDKGFAGLASEVGALKQKLYLFSGGLAVVIFFIEIGSKLFRL